MAGAGLNCDYARCGHYTNAGSGHTAEYACNRGRFISYQGSWRGRGDSGSDGCLSAPAGWYVPGNAVCNPTACPVGQYNQGIQNTGCTGCPNGHYQEKKGQSRRVADVNSWPGCHQSCAWSHLYAYPATTCSISFDGNRHYTCEGPFKGKHCEVMNEDPIVFAVAVKVYGTDDPRAFIGRDFANTDHHDRKRPKDDGGVMQGDNGCKKAMPHGAGCVATAPRLFTNHRKLQIDVEWSHGYQVTLHHDGAARGQSLMHSRAIGISSSVLTMGAGAPAYTWSRPGHAPSRDNPHTSHAFGMKARFSPGHLKESHCKRFDLSLTLGNGGRVDMNWYYDKRTNAKRNNRRYFNGRSAKRILPVTVDYVAPFNKNHKRSTQFTGCAAEEGAIKNKEHHNVWTNQFSLKNYDCCVNTVKKETTIQIREWKDDCSPVWRYYLEFCPMRTLATLSEYAGQDPHTQKPYCAEEEDWYADTMSGNKHIMIPPISTQGGPAQKFAGNTAVTPGAIAAMGSAEITVTRTFSREGLWSAVTVVKDSAENIRKSRRFILHDPKPMVEYVERSSNTQKDGGPHIRSAGCRTDVLHHKTADKSGIWQDVHEGGKWSVDCLTGATPSGARELWQWNNTFLTVDWHNMFHAKNEKWLKPIKAHAGVEEAYDDPMVCGPIACPSNTKDMKRRLGTPNDRGITKFEWYVTSPSGGPTIIPVWTEVKFQGGAHQSPHRDSILAQWKKVGRPATLTRLALKGIKPESIGGPIDLTMDKVLANGHIYEVGIRATEIFGNQLVKKTRFRLDTSPPEIIRFGITRGTEQELAVHNLHDLTKMALEFETFDAESSIRQIQWRLHKHTNVFLPHCKPGDTKDCDQKYEDPSNPYIDDVSEAVTIVPKADDCKTHPTEACLCTVPGDLCHVRKYVMCTATHLYRVRCNAPRPPSGVCYEEQQTAPAGHHVLFGVPGNCAFGG